MAGGAAACAPPCTMLTHEGASLGRGRLLDGGRVRVGPVLPDQPVTPVEGEAGGGGCTPALLLAYRCRPQERWRWGGRGREYALVVAFTICVAG